MKPPTSYLLHLTVLLYNTSLLLRTIFYAKALLSATQQHFKSGSNDIIIAVVNIIKNPIILLREQQTFLGPSACSCSYCFSYCSALGSIDNEIASKYRSEVNYITKTSLECDFYLRGDSE